MKDRHTRKKLVRDAVLVIVSIACAILLMHFGILGYFLGAARPVGFMSSFVSGIFFTSIFTTPLSIVSFATIAQSTNITAMALFGACGSVVGDLIIFLFIQDTLSEDIEHVIHAPQYDKITRIFKKRIFRWLTPMVGALIIASPLPDELGLAMMGFSKMKTAVLIPVSFVMNFAGIFLIGLAAQAL